MKLLGHPYKCITSNVEEDYIEGETPSEHVTRLSELKAKDVAADITEGLIIGSDTVVVIDNDILGKPESPAEALEMIMRLQGRSHTVYTGFAVYNSDTGKMHSGHETTSVSMRAISTEMAKKYVETEEPLDKAGSYGIQGFGAVLIDSIEGCYFNVMGLPLSRLMEAIYISSNGTYNYFGTTGEFTK
jgi:septum formation protein